jgi:hypothetical protein
MIDGQVHKLLGKLELGKAMHKSLKKLLHMVV